MPYDQVKLDNLIYQTHARVNDLKFDLERASTRLRELADLRSLLDTYGHEIQPTSRLLEGNPTLLFGDEVHAFYTEGMIACIKKIRENRQYNLMEAKNLFDAAYKKQ